MRRNTLSLHFNYTYSDQLKYSNNFFPKKWKILMKFLGHFYQVFITMQI